MCEWRVRATIISYRTEQWLVWTVEEETFFFLSFFFSFISVFSVDSGRPLKMVFTRKKSFSVAAPRPSPITILAVVRLLHTTDAVIHNTLNSIFSFWWKRITKLLPTNSILAFIFRFGDESERTQLFLHFFFLEISLKFPIRTTKPTPNSY